MHGRRKDVVRALRPIYMVIRMNGYTFSPSDSYLDSLFSNHFIHIHIKLRTATGHPHGQGKVSFQMTRQDFIASRFNGPSPHIIQVTQLIIRFGCRFFQISKDRDQLLGNFFRADLEVFQTSLRLCSPKFVGRNLYFS